MLKGGRTPPVWHARRHTHGYHNVSAPPPATVSCKPRWIGQRGIHTAQFSAWWSVLQSPCWGVDRSYQSTWHLVVRCSSPISFGFSAFRFASCDRLPKKLARVVSPQVVGHLSCLPGHHWLQPLRRFHFLFVWSLAPARARQLKMIFSCLVMYLGVWARPLCQLIR